MADFLDESNRGLHWTLSTLAAISGILAFFLKPINRLRKSRKERIEREKRSEDALTKILLRLDAQDLNLERQSRSLDRNTCVTLQTLNLTGARIFESNLNGECIWVSFEWSNLTGFSLADAKGYGWTQAICEHDVDRVVKAWDESWKTQRPFLCRYHYCRRDGSRVLVEVRAYLMQGSDGKPVGYLCHVKPIDPSEDRNENQNSGSPSPVHRGDGANGGRPDRPRVADS